MLVFDRAGTSLIAAQSDALAVVDLERRTTRRIPVRDARVVAAFDDQIWIATDVALVRFEWETKQNG